MGVFDSLLNNTFEVFRKTVLEDGQGGFPHVWESVGTIEGRICPTTAANRIVADSEESQITHVFYTTAGADVLNDDRLVLGEMTFEVESIREPSLNDHHLEVDCMLRQYAGTTTESGS